MSKSEIHIEKLDRIYIIRIDPVKLHSAGVYTCEDDVSIKTTNGISSAMSKSNLTMHVIGVHMNNPMMILNKESNYFSMFKNNYLKIKNNSFKSSIYIIFTYMYRHNMTFIFYK